MNSLYENLQRATDNTQDIINERYGVVTKVHNETCNVKETDTDLEHSNVVILSQDIQTGDSVILGFADNDLYKPYIAGKVGEYTGGSGGGSLVGSFSINEDGYLIATLPSGTTNPYSIDENGDLIYNTEV